MKQVKPEPITPMVYIHRSDTGRRIPVRVELAIDEASRARGLMFRTRMEKESGMLFIFDTEEIHSFWMKDTLIPLDMIFIRADKTIAGIIENAAPMTLQSRQIDTPSRYVLEVEAGFAAANHLQINDRIEFSFTNG